VGSRESREALAITATPTQDELAHARAREEHYRARAERLDAFSQTRYALSRAETLARRGIHAALREILVEGAKQLGVARAGVWFFEAQTLRAVVLWAAGEDLSTEGVSLSKSEIPTYFAALREAQVIASHDTKRDPHCAELLPSYLVPLGIGAMLDAPIRVFGDLVGVLCYEHIGPSRVWLEEEQSFAASLGDLAALAVMTARHQEAARSVEDHEAKYRALVESLPVVVYSLRPGRRALDYVSPQAETLSGVALADLSGENGFHAWLNAIHPEDRLFAKSRFSHELSVGDIPEIEYRLVHTNGEVRWVRDACRVLAGPDGAPHLIQGVIQDITEQARAHSAQYEAERRFYDLLDRGPLLAVAVTQDGQIAFINNALLSLLNLAPEDALGRDWFSLAFLPKERSSARALLLREGDVRHSAPSCDLTLVTPDGPRTVRWANTPLLGPNGEPLGVASVGVDLTSRIQLETKLLEAQKNESLARLAAGAAHDINNVLASINGAISSLREVAPPEGEIADALQELISGVTRATEFTGALLRFARQHPSQPQQVELDGLLRDASGLARIVMGAPIGFTVALGAPGRLVCIDPTQLRQVVLNLAANARDAMPRGGYATLTSERVTLDISQAIALGGLSAGRYLCFSLQDTGTGMSQRDAQRAFEPFFSTKGERGTGLGLAVSYGVIHQAGGHITIESLEGKGSTFTVYLPDVSPSDDPAETALGGGNEIRPRILLVDDNAFVRESLSEGLREHGLTVVVASDAAQALRLAERHAAHLTLLISDLIMPGGDGLSLNRHLQSLLPGLRTIFISGGFFGDMPDSPGAAFLQKPFSVDDLLQLIREVAPDLLPPPSLA
jgi:hypothetical protein